MLIMNFVPYLGYIVIPGVLSLTLMIIPVAVITVHLGKSGALFGWITFAFLSFVSLPLRGGVTLAFFGWTGSFIALVLGRLSACGFVIIVLIIIQKSKFANNIYIKACVVGFCTPLLNSVFVLSFFYISKSDLHNKYFFVYFFSYYLNIIVEIAASLFVSISFVPVFKHLHIKKINDTTWGEK